jgi:hypothetical protein
MKMSFVQDGNMYLLKNKTVEECKQICNNDPLCLAFEYGVNYGSTDGDY